MELKYNHKIEKYLIKNILPELDRARPNWDKPHTKAVVYYIKKIIVSLKNTVVDQNVLIIAGYLHDWGYADLYNQNKPQTIANIKKYKKKHMISGAKKAQQILNNFIFDFLTKNQKFRIAHLVRVHDELSKIKELDETILVEADTLAVLDTDLVGATIDKASNDKYLHEVRTKRFPIFKTDYSLSNKERLFLRRQQFFDRK